MRTDPTTSKMGRPSVPIEERFWAKVQKTDSCWLWTGSTGKKGYGQIWSGGVNGTHLRTHRLSWEIHFGRIPDGMKVCHNCPDGDNPRCVNPAHLFLGTDADNAQDSVQKGRRAKGDTHGQRLHPERVARGEHQGSSKLTDEKVREIRKRYAEGNLTFDAMAQEFGVSNRTISRIVKREQWAHVE